MEQARIKASEGAIAEVKSRLSMGYGQYILENNVIHDEAFCIVEFHLFGDPSLKLGGYE